jgi:hypothetical protein
VIADVEKKNLFASGIEKFKENAVVGVYGEAPNMFEFAVQGVGMQSWVERIATK